MSSTAIQPAPAPAIEPQSAEDEARTAGLVARAQAGDNAALTQLYLDNFDSVYAYLRVALNDSFEAEDAAQQVFTKVLESLPTYERRGQPFRAWLFVIARNQAIDHMRKYGRISVEEPAQIDRRREPLQSTESRALHWTGDDELVMLVERLPQAQRQVVVLRFVMEFNGSEIAKILGRSPEAVRQLQCRALRFLKRRLTALGREPRALDQQLSGRAGRAG